MSKKKRDRQQNGPDARESEVGTVSRPKFRGRTLAPAAGVIIIVLAAIIWLYRGSSGVTSDLQSSSAAQSGKTTTKDKQAPVPTTGGPSIHFPEPSYDFGSIAQKAKVSHTFIVQNTGDEPLKLIKAKGS